MGPQNGPEDHFFLTLSPATMVWFFISFSFGFFFFFSFVASPLLQIFFSPLFLFGGHGIPFLFVLTHCDTKQSHFFFPSSPPFPASCEAVPPSAFPHHRNAPFFVFLIWSTTLGFCHLVLVLLPLYPQRLFTCSLIFSSPRFLFFSV